MGCFIPIVKTSNRAISPQQSFDSSPLHTKQVQENQRRLASDLQTMYDHVIYGAGTSGSVLAARLAANPAAKVLLLEAGGTHDADLVMDPNRWVLLWEAIWIGAFKQKRTPFVTGGGNPFSGPMFTSTCHSQT